MNSVIEVNELRKSYGALSVVKGISLDIHKGEIFAILGPNGAGKTTTVEILEGFRAADSGSVRVLDTEQLRARQLFNGEIASALSCKVRKIQPS